MNTTSILVLGTSNSILKGGYVEGLRSELPEARIVNASIGASPGLQFGVFLQKDIADFTYIIFDSTPNDEQYAYETRGYSEDVGINRILFELLSSISSKCNLIVIGFCNKRHLERKSNVYKIRHEMTRAVGGHFIDVSEYLLSYRILESNAASDLYEDHPAHPNVKISFKIGQLIAKKMRSNSFENRSGASIDFSGNFVAVRISEVTSGYAIKTFKNSLMEDSFSVIHATERLNFVPERLVGFYVNSRATCCQISLYLGGTKVSEGLLNYPPGDGVEKLFVPIPGAPKIDSIVVKDFDGDVGFAPRMIANTTSVDHNSGSEIQMSEILFWKGSLNEEWTTKHAISEYECTKVSREIFLDLMKASIAQKIVDLLQG